MTNNIFCRMNSNLAIPFIIILFLFLSSENIISQNRSININLPIIKSNDPYINILDGTNFKNKSWRLDPELNPDVYFVSLIQGEPHYVTFYTDIDSISFLVEIDKSYDFIIELNGEMCYQRLIGQKFVSAAVFDNEYIENRKGKIFIQIPEVYELVNVAMAITTFGKNNKNYIYQHSEYYQRVQNWFEKYQKNDFVTTLDSILSNNSGYYASLKMNGNAFVFDKNGKVQRSKVFARTGFRDQRTNTLLPYLEKMRSFANESNFMEFYKKNMDTYNGQINFYRDSINIPEMQNWLDKNFPGSNTYDTYNIIFSPLVAYNQSTTWFESNNFKELQPHVNFPYRQDLKSLFPISKNAEYIYRGNIVFTEINHGYINPEGEKYSSRIDEAISNRYIWVDSTKSANYYSGARIFHEYMNWGLVSLRISDYVQKGEQEKLIKKIVHSMSKGRGFIMFKEFNQFLIKIYRTRKEDNTIADLYPQIIEWFENNNKVNN